MDTERRIRPLDLSKHFLGTLCKRGHDWEGTGKSLRYFNNGRGGNCCVECVIERNKANRDPEEQRAYYAMWINRPGSREKVRAAERRYRTKPGTMAKANAARRRRYHERDKHDPAFVVFNRVRANLSTNMRRYAAGKELTRSQYGIDTEAIIASLGPCPGPREEWHIDHIIPVAEFDLANPGQVRQCWAPANLRWLRAEDNIARRWGRYAD